MTKNDHAAGTVTPYPENAAPKKQQVAGMFDRIARRYDFLNHFLSFGIDTYWRKIAVKSFRRSRYKLDGDHEHFLDVATGTADLALEACRQGAIKITGVDISENMLEIGRKKISQRKVDSCITLQLADSEKLPFLSDFFSGVMVAFGVRNFADLDKGLGEIHRVLKPGGKAVVLEFSKPRAFPFKQIYGIYFSFILPVLGSAISRDRAAYNYLHRSVTAFPDGNEFLKRLEGAGFGDTAAKPLTLGICTVYTGTKT